MKPTITILLLLSLFAGHSQIIDNRVAYVSDSIATRKTDSLNSTLESVFQVDITKQGTFNIDTIRVNNGEIKWFNISFTCINGSLLGQCLYQVTVGNLNGVFFLPVNGTTQYPFRGMSGVSVTVMLINGGANCVVRIIAGPTIKIHYRRSEI